MDPENYAEYPVTKKELHQAMLWFAAEFSHLPCTESSLIFYSDRLSPVQMRAIWEHAKANRISYGLHEDNQFSTEIVVLAGATLEEWRVSNLVNDAQQARAMDSSSWPSQAEAARRFGFNPMKIHRLIKKEALQTNGKEGRECRIDPSSILKYCDKEGVTYNET